jgi:hypothetical protein
MGTGGSGFAEGGAAGGFAGIDVAQPARTTIANMEARRVTNGFNGIREF